ncbi:carbohydrate kinase [Prevotella brunnea]|uniref:Carbohydrate kinase n=1 Tax=Prevotella brunnea TaxID=2508867 RepID=A0A5C8GI30_9BACT|nr:carbohydrate kinase [Prevotella brunnea]TXJ61602.1 carbohydrate kinase [Prevotella brunnea]
MRKIIGIGETILDIFFKNGQPIGAYPGGSTFNAMISLGRSGMETTFISEVGDDRVGDFIKRFLIENGVNAERVTAFPGSKSPVSLAFLNERNDAEYIFYKDHPHDRLEFPLPDIHSDDIVLFGSYYALNPVIRQQVVSLLELARSRGAIIYYDVNFRSSHVGEVIKLTPNLLENLDYADIVRGSKEDFVNLYKKDDAEKVYNSDISFYCKRFIYTDGARPIEVRGENGFKKSYEMQSIDTVSTVGAGDNFNAGFIFGLIKHGITREDLERGLAEAQWDKLIACAQAFAADCCKDIYNYVSKEFGASVQQS